MAVLIDASVLLQLLRTILVQNKQLARLCKQLGFDQFIRTEVNSHFSVFSLKVASYNSADTCNYGTYTYTVILSDVPASICRLLM